MPHEIEWLLGIAFPIALIAAAAKLVSVKIEVRQKAATRAVRKYEAWLRKSTRPRRSHEKATGDFIRRAADRNLSSRRGIWNGLLADVYGVVIVWTRLRALPGKYLDDDRHDLIQRRKTYMEQRAAEHAKNAGRDKAHARGMLRTSVSWEVFFEEGGWVALLGAMAMVSAGLLGWWFESVNVSLVWGIGLGLRLLAVRGG